MKQTKMMGYVEVPERIAETQSRVALIAMLSGEHDKAIAAIKRAFDMAAELSSEKVTLRTPVASLFSTRIANRLEDSNIHTVVQLIAWSPQRLKRIDGVSWTTIAKIQKKLAEHGFLLAELSSD